MQLKQIKKSFNKYIINNKQKIVIYVFIYLSNKEK